MIWKKAMQSLRTKSKCPNADARAIRVYTNLLSIICPALLSRVRLCTPCLSLVRSRSLLRVTAEVKPSQCPSSLPGSPKTRPLLESQSCHRIQQKSSTNGRDSASAARPTQSVAEWRFRAKKKYTFSADSWTLQSIQTALGEQHAASWSANECDS